MSSTVATQIKLRPLGARVVVEQLDAQKVSHGGIVLPDSAEKPREGRVLAVGPGEENEQGILIVPKIQVGERVLFTAYSGSEFKQDGRTLMIFAARDILAVIGE